MHGKTLTHPPPGSGVFAGPPDGYEATRYHSLVVDKATLFVVLEITAWTENEDGSMEEIRACAIASSRSRAVPSRIHPHPARPRAAGDLERS